MNKIITLCFFALSIAVTSNTANAAMNPISTDLTIGSTGEQVVILQDFLRAEGVFTLESTGYFGSITEGALKKYQTNNGLTATGMIDAATIAVLQTEEESAEIVAKAALERNPDKVPFAFGALKLYLGGLDAEAEGTAAIVKKAQWAVSMLERIMQK